MTKKYNNSDEIKNADAVDHEAYVTWGEDLSSKQEALKKSSESL